MNDKYATLPHQLELPFGGRFGYCPTCNPTGDPRKDAFRSMCDRHWREYNASFDQEAFKNDLEYTLEQGRKDANACLSYPTHYPTGRFR